MESGPIAFSPDGKRLSLAPRTNPFVSGMPRLARWSLAPLKTNRWSPVCRIFSRWQTDCLWLSDKSIHVWDAGTGEMVSGPFEGHNRWSPVRRIFSRWQTDCLWLLGQIHSCLGCRDWRDGLWPLRRTHRWRSGPSPFSPDGKQIVSGSWDKSIRVWDAETGEMVSGPSKDTQMESGPSHFLPMANGLSLAPSKDTRMQSGPSHFLPMANRLSLAPRTNPFVSGMPRLARWSFGPLRRTHRCSPVRRIFSRWQTDCLWLPRQIHSCLGCRGLAKWSLVPSKDTQMESGPFAFSPDGKTDCLWLLGQIYSCLGY